MLSVQLNSSQCTSICLEGPEREMLVLSESKPCTEGKVCYSFWLASGMQSLGRTRVVGCSHLTLLGVLLSVNPPS